MNKKFRQKSIEEELDDFDDYRDLKFRKNKRKERRFNRALKVMDIDQLIENENYDELEN